MCEAVIWTIEAIANDRGSSDKKAAECLYTDVRLTSLHCRYVPKHDHDPTEYERAPMHCVNEGDGAAKCPTQHRNISTRITLWSRSVAQVNESNVYHLYEYIGKAST
jgi:hypothetical protein